jgi:hypothetical protein
MAAESTRRRGIARRHTREMPRTALAIRGIVGREPDRPVPRSRHLCRDPVKGYAWRCRCFRPRLRFLDYRTACKLWRYRLWVKKPGPRGCAVHTHISSMPPPASTPSTTLIDTKSDRQVPGASLTRSIRRRRGSRPSSPQRSGCRTVFGRCDRANSASPVSIPRFFAIRCWRMCRTTSGWSQTLRAEVSTPSCSSTRSGIAPTTWISSTPARGRSGGRASGWRRGIGRGRAAQGYRRDTLRSYALQPDSQDTETATAGLIPRHRSRDAGQRRSAPAGTPRLPRSRRGRAG